MGRLLDAAQPCLFRVRRKAFNAVLTIAPIVRPLLFAYFRRPSTVRGGSFKVTGIVVSGNFDGAIELRGFLEIAIGLTLGKIELARQLANCIGARQLTLQ